MGHLKPLISKTLFQRVQDLKSKKGQKKSTRHNHTYRQLITCGACGRYLIGERQKGQVYYRCHHCKGVGIREDRLECLVRTKLQGVALKDEHIAYLKERARQQFDSQNENHYEQAINIQLAKLTERDDRLTDALIDGLIDKQTCADRRFRLQAERERLGESLQEGTKTKDILQIFDTFLELSKSLCFQYEMAKKDQKRRLVQILFSNFSLQGKEPYFTTQNWLLDPENALSALCGPPQRDEDRTAGFEIINFVRFISQNRC